MKNACFPFSPCVMLFALSMFLPSGPCSPFADTLATSGPVIVEPLSVPAEAAGWGREYVPVAAETFSTPIRVPARGFSLQPGGQWVTDSDGISWVQGSSAGQSDYLPYYGTEPGVLPLTGGREYQLTFTYRIEETPDRGFEAVFYSPGAGSKNHWVPGIRIEGKKGKSGTATFRARLFAESDYRAWWTVVHRGRIAIRDIEITDVSTGVVVARDDLAAKSYGPGRELACRGFTPESEAPGTLVLRYPGALRTVPSVLPLEPDTVYIVEFSWRARKRNTERPTILGFVGLFSERDETHLRNGKRIEGGELDEGHYVGGIRTGSAAAPYVLQIAPADKVELLISDLRFLRQQPRRRGAEENAGLALSRAPFPRLGNYQGGLPDYIAWDASGRAKGKLPLMSTAELDRRLALYDVVVGLSGATTTLDPAACLRLRELNPDIVLLPYVISHEPSRAKWLLDQYQNPLADAEAEFARGIDEGWLLRTSKGALVEDLDFPWFAKANISPYCPRDRLGRDYIDYFTEKTIDLWFRDGTWDGLFMDNLLAQRNIHIKNAYDSRAFDADYNRNGRRDETIPWTHEMTARASLRMLRQLRQRLGDAEILIGNAGPYPELLLAPYVNGYTFELFNYPWYENAGPNGFSEAHWGETFSNYRQMEATVRQPAAIILEATGPTPQTGAQLTGDYHGPTSRDIRIQRIALGTALLGNGFYEYDLFHNLDAPSFFDEWLVGPDGASVDDATGKGWLGPALGPAVELCTGEKSVLVMPAPRRIGEGAGAVLQTDCGVNRSGASLQYVVEFDWQVEATLEHPAYLNFELDGRAFDGTPINGLVAGTAGHTRTYLTTPAQHHLVVKIHVTDAGVLTVKNLKITTAHCGVFRRDFQNGVVFVNATNEPRTLSAEDVQGSLQRSGLKRIAGKLDPEVNNGKPVQDSLALPAADALVLLADSL